MTSDERREARFQRRSVKRAKKRQKSLSQYDDFRRIVSVDNLYEAFLQSKRGVSWKESVQRYEANALRNVIEARRKLLAGESVQCGFKEFTLRERGKIRRIRSVHISERVIQKCLCNQVLTPILSHSLIHDNGASVKHKGVHFAVRRFIVHLSRFYRQNNFSNDGYALLIDFSKFFDSIDHETLFRLLEKAIKDEQVLVLTKKFVTVFGDGKSLGLGSQVSQIAAIFFPSIVDHYIKDMKGEHFYGRYMDDLYIIHKDRTHLKNLFDEIKTICNSLKITINMKKTRIVKLSSGVDFLKGRYFLLHSGRILRRPRKDSTLRMKRKLRKFKSLVENGKMGYEDVRTSYQSWRGNFQRRFDAYHQVRNMDTLYNELFISRWEENHERGLSHQKEWQGHSAYRP